MTIHGSKSATGPFLDEDFEYVMTKKGQPVAVIVKIEKFRSLLETFGILSSKDFTASIKRAREEMKRGKKLLTPGEVF